MLVPRKVATQEKIHSNLFLLFDRQGEEFATKNVAWCFLLFSLSLFQRLVSGCLFCGKTYCKHGCFPFAGFVVDDEVDQRGLKSSSFQQHQVFRRSC